MKQSKLISILKTLRPKEIQQFDELLRSSFFSTKSDTLRLWEYLHPISLKSRQAPPELQKEVVLEKLFPQKKLADKILRVCMSELTKHLEFFLVMVLLKKEPLPRRKLKIQAFEQRTLYEQFSLAIELLIQQHPEESLKSASYHLDMMQLHETYFFHPNTDKHDSKHNEIQTAMEHLDAFYLLTKLRYSCELFNRSHVLAKSYHILLLDEIRQIAVSSKFDNMPLCQIYLALVNLFLNGYKPKDYQDIKSDFLRHQQKMNPDEQQTILYYLINIILRQINSGDTTLVKESLQLYKIGLEKNILIRNKEIPYVTFINIVCTGAVSKDYKWTRKFIDQYHKSLTANMRKYGYQSALAFYYFHKGEHKEVPHAINELKFVKQTHTLLLRSILLRSYYELIKQNTDYESLFSAELENFYRYLKYHQYMRKDEKKAYENFRRFTKKLAGIRKKGIVNSERKEQLHQLLQKMELVATRQWLKEKIDEL